MWFLVLLVVLAALAAWLFTRLYVKTPANMAFIRTGLGGKRVVIDGGALVWPLVQHIQWLSLETFKLEVVKSGKEAFITRDRLRVDVGAEFYLKIPPDAAAIERAARSLGEKSFSPEGVHLLIQEKLISALRAVIATMELIEMHENRRRLALAVMEQLQEPLLAANGLMLEEVSIFHLDQTERGFLDPGNVFDAEGLRQIAAQVSERARQRNEIERNTEVAIKRKDVEAVKLKLALDQERAFAEAEQAKAVETYRAQRLAETEQFKAEQERLAREAEIAKRRAIREAEIAEAQAIRAAELQREVFLLGQQRLRELAEIEKAQAVEEAQQDKAIAVLLKERARLEEEQRRLQAEALKEQAAQEVITAAERLAAERARELAVIAALQELEVAMKKAEARERLAAARRQEGEAEAYALLKQREAENTLEEKIIRRDLLLALIERAPQLVAELMAPAKQIDSIRILDVGGWRANGAAGETSAVDRVIAGVLGAGAALPLLKELLDFARLEPAQLLQRLAEQLPGLREALARQEPPH
ncbi:MAG: flotillin [Candidatus Tectimicrobiota bacterium]|nr:MAG: flotillin [Candidatus Tectomicrobia bacterium]